PILFLVYLQPLFTFLDKRHPDVFFPSYIDDVAIVVTGSNEEANSKRLSTIAKDAIRWSESNALSFDGPKTELIHFQHRTKPPTPNHSVTLPSSTISPSSVVRWLGVWLDKRLSFHEHVRIKIAAATRAFFALRRMANTQHGLTVSSMRQLYTSAVLPVLDYGAEIW